MPRRSGIPLTINKYLLWVESSRSRPLSTSQSTFEVGATHYPNELSPLSGRHNCRYEYLGLLLFGYTFVAGAIRASKSLNVKRCTNGPISTSASPAALREIAS